MNRDSSALRMRRRRFWTNSRLIRWPESVPGFFQFMLTSRLLALVVPGFRAHSRKSSAVGSAQFSTRQKGRWQMKKVLSALLAGMLLSPQFVLATEKSGPVPPVPSSGNVTLPLDEYNRLLELANKPSRKIETPPVPYTMKRADLKFHVASESVHGIIQLQGEILHKGATKVPLTTGMAILDARQEGKNLPVELEGGTHTTVLTGPAEFAVTL